MKNLAINIIYMGEGVTSGVKLHGYLYQIIVKIPTPSKFCTYLYIETFSGLTLRGSHTAVYFCVFG
jgi:hypothetical protein|tara:strand:- start:172 stop:369 length:198 start_codon:yes stop_codon:yes gene_type:complete